jgi:cell division protein FtsI/penicillin-binding protein 2
VASTVANAGMQNAEVVISVVVEHGGDGSGRAAPITGALLAAWKAGAGH